MTQPLTAKQLSFVTEKSFLKCQYAITTLTKSELLHCVNPTARRGRLYYLTKQGAAEQAKLRKERKLPVAPKLPDVDWDLYGWVCFSHRSLVVKTLTRPMQPPRIKKVAYGNDKSIRFSADNCRAVIREFRARGIVEPVFRRKKKHPQYQLTEAGLQFQELLWQVGVAWS